MAGRRDDSTPDRPSSSSARPGLPAPRRRTLHTVGLVAGLLLALGATAAVLATDDARYLRVALLAACWAFLVAAFLAGGRRADQVAADSREAELRHAYEVELEREVAARAQYELHLEQQLRREAEEGMRQELAGLRGELTGLSALRDDLAALGRLRGELAGLNGLRGELAGLGELRDDLGRLRSELSEQLSGELLIERMVMRAQAVRLPAERSDDGRELDGVASTGGPASGAWAQQTTVESWTDSRDEAPLTPSAAVSAAMPAAVVTSATGEPGLRRPPPPPPIGSTRRLVPADEGPAAGDEDARRASAVPSSPGEEPTWQPSDLPPSALPSAFPGRPGPTPSSRHRVGLDAAPAGQGDAAAPRRHRRAAEPDGDDRAAGSAPLDDLAPSRSAASVVPAADAPDGRWWDSPAGSGSPVGDRGEPHEAPAAPAPVGPGEPVAGLPAGASGGHVRLEQILAESGVSPAPGRRRRRHRDDDASESAADVLARVLGNAPPL